MVMHNYGRPWADYSRAHAKDALRPISATVIRERPQAILISTGIRTVWVPRSLVTHEPEKHRFLMPHWLAEKKLLD